jgi:hypothetical protein
MRMIFQDPRTQMSFTDTMCNNYAMVPFFRFKRGERFLMGPYVVIFISFRSPIQYKGKFPSYVKCKDLRLHHQV